jgi:NADH dehydrogenase [ubiquinone] 1 alpha subcomplex assembly factor 1
MLRRLLDFDESSDLAGWRSVDDVVMGGQSQSALLQLEQGIARFAGLVSLERGGGFASVRTEPRDWPAQGAVAFVLRCCSDDHAYKLTLRTTDDFDGVQYQHRFMTQPRAWRTVRLAVADFVPSFRGRVVLGAPPLDPGKVRQLGLMISEKQAGAFELLIDWIAVEMGSTARLSS